VLDLGDEFDFGHFGRGQPFAFSFGADWVLSRHYVSFRFCLGFEEGIGRIDWFGFGLEQSGLTGAVLGESLTRQHQELTAGVAGGRGFDRAPIVGTMIRATIGAVTRTIYWAIRRTIRGTCDRVGRTLGAVVAAIAGCELGFGQSAAAPPTAPTASAAFTPAFPTIGAVLVLRAFCRFTGGTRFAFSECFGFDRLCAFGFDGNYIDCRLGQSQGFVFSTVLG